MKENTHDITKLLTLESYTLKLYFSLSCNKYMLAINIENCYLILTLYEESIEFVKIFDLRFSTQLYILKGPEDDLTVRKCFFMSLSVCLSVYNTNFAL